MIQREHVQCEIWALAYLLQKAMYFLRRGRLSSPSTVSSSWVCRALRWTWRTCLARSWGRRGGRRDRIRGTVGQVGVLQQSPPAPYHVLLHVVFILDNEYHIKSAEDGWHKVNVLWERKSRSHDFGPIRYLMCTQAHSISLSVVPASKHRVGSCQD